MQVRLERLRAAKKFEGTALRLRLGARHPNERPRVVEVSPAGGAVGIDPVTEIRIRFDRPIDRESFFLQWKAVRAAQKVEVGFRLRDAIRYLAERNEFVFPVRLTPESEHRIEVVADDVLHASSKAKWPGEFARPLCILSPCRRHRCNPVML